MKWTKRQLQESKIVTLYYIALEQGKRAEAKRLLDRLEKLRAKWNKLTS